MAKNDQRAGYSEALGGYGVPSQVQVTGGGVNAGKSPKTARARKSRGLVFRPKPWNIVLIVVVIAAIVVAILFGNGMLGSNQYAKDIAAVNQIPQTVNGVESMVYQPVVAEGVDWDSVSDGRREGIAKYAINSILEDYGTSGIFSIMGVTSDGNQAFLYSQDGRIQLYKNREVEEVITLE
jgi:hypothetical protein